MLISQDKKILKAVIAHEAIVLTANTLIMAAVWFGMTYFGFDPPTVGWTVGLTGEAVTILIDQFFHRQYLTTVIIFLRCFINFLVALFFVAVSGLCVLIFDVPGAKGSYTLFMIGTALVIMVATTRCAFYLLCLATKFDLNPITRWFKSDNAGETVIDMPEEA